MSNWKKTVLVLVILIFLVLLQPTRQLLYLILPLGSGIDDLIFWILCFVLLIVLLIRIDDYGTWLERLKIWFRQ